MAGDFGGTNRTAGHDSSRGRHERHPPGRASALLLVVRAFRPEADFRRRFRQCLESGTGSGATGAGYAAPRCGAANGHGLESGRPDLFFHPAQHQSAYDAMELKSIEDWVIEKNFKAVADIVDVSSFGGPTREYQVRVDPNKLVSY